MKPTPEQYAAASLLEVIAIGDEGKQRETSRQIVLDGGPSAQGVANEARAMLCHQVAQLEQAIVTLGLR